jgi:histidine triad (HIT) family protein
VTDCLFCRIATGEIPAQFVYEDDSVVAFHDVDPQAPVHVLVVPRRHVPNLPVAAAEDPELIARVVAVVAQVAALQGIDESGYRSVVNTGPDAQQSVQHLHFHVIGGRQLGWPPG